MGASERMLADVPALGMGTQPGIRSGSGALAPALTALFASTLFVSAGLIFVVQPMFARMVLPHLGGSPAVWNTCVVFFQAAMLAGYAYAHLSTRWLAPARQAVVHMALLAGAAVVLPIAMPSGWSAPIDGTPVPALLLVLAVALGLPFFAVAATAPLLQHWFSRTAHPSARDPYFLYAASNAGSMLALVGYPFLIEPGWTLSQQSTGWTAAYGLLAVLIAACAWSSRARWPGEGAVTAAEGTQRTLDPTAGPAMADVTPLRRLRWVALAAVPSSLLLGVTTFLTSDVAAVPLLWTLPLALYLLTFVIAFSVRPIVSSRLSQQAMAVFVLPLVVSIVAGVGDPLWLLMPLHLAAFFACALVLHGLLARDRPHTSHLTEFYLWISVGGLLGGVFNTLVAPLVFTSVLEYPLAVALACALRAGAPAGGSTRPRVADLALPLVFAVAVVGGVASLKAAFGGPALLLAAIAAACASYVWCARRPLRFASAILLVVTGGTLFLQQGGDLIHAERTFFGVLRVKVDRHTGVLSLLHGRTIHGEQDPARPNEPMSYYHPAGPIGQMLGEASFAPPRVAVVGLGTGGLAAYARPGQQWTFYEIDPAVERVARTPAFFTYLSACGDACQVVLGDARLSLEARAPGAYDFIVLDAFSSDAIPAHLVTREAMELYVSRLAPDGLIAFHISNRHLDLRPVLGALAESLGLRALVQFYRPAGDAGEGRPSEWAVLARSDARLAALAADARWDVLPSGRARPWTDDYSDILSVLRY
jgi:hypothetical protein